ncbi:phosphonate metabolism protein/1,5-bisphosphokinase (PRPP-forming) PhnN [Aquicoccus porphyridii]|uniref:phosphonate metabolism protein/1,5-bisphosphokinase (PRPP-forming) PhnN n=1 Tax=Aquicoccus porphyridii TaxID=1852029 RepID=UPI00273D9623|nr:phosphonate metabolism protein/1,5-bisphosphokinase (PRPP-forming) PhnN [Aquicoccus porphyridii]
MSGAIFAIVGPSGAGKDTLMQAAAARLPGLYLVRRVITRAEDAGGEEFEGITEAEFSTRLARGEFALHWQAHGLRYGIPASVLGHLARGKTVLFNGSRAMLDDAARAFPGLRVIHITASDAVLAQRLHARDRETAPDIAARLTRARLPLPEGLDVTEIDNSGPLDAALDRLISILAPDPETTT